MTRTSPLCAAAALAVFAAFAGTSSPALAAPKKKGFLRALSDNLGGKFKTNASKQAQPLAGTYSVAANALSIAGGFARAGGIGRHHHALTQAISLTATVPDLETRTDFPVTYNTSAVTFDEVASEGVPGSADEVITARSWGGTSQMRVTVESWHDLGVKQGRHVALVKGTFFGGMPVLAGDVYPLVMSDGEFSLQVEIAD